MIAAIATSALTGFVQKQAGVKTAGTIPAALLTSGVSLLLTRGRRPVGLAVAALGGFLLWRELERQREEVSPGAGPAEAPTATGSR